MKNVYISVAKFLRKKVKSRHYVEVGVGAEVEYCVSREQFNKAIRLVMQDDKCKLTVMKLEKGSTTQILHDRPLSKEVVEKNREIWITERKRALAQKRKIEESRKEFK